MDTNSKNCRLVVPTFVYLNYWIFYLEGVAQHKCKSSHIIYSRPVFRSWIPDSKKLLYFFLVFGKESE